MRRLRLFSIFFVLLIFLAPASFDTQSGLQVTYGYAAPPTWLELGWSAVKDPIGTGGSLIFGSLLASLGTVANAITTFFLSIAGLLFDALIRYAIVDFGTILNASVMQSINMVWSAFRDIANIVIIGMFVFVAFATILSAAHYNIKQFAVKICIVALLMNFSLFFTKAVIDVSNFVAFQFYKGMSSLQVKNTQGTNSGIGIASRLMTSIGATGGIVGTDIGSGNNLIWDNVGTNISGVFVTILGLFAFTTLATVILFYGVFQLILRVVMLIVLMSVSALAVAAYIVPRFKTYQEQWLAALMQQAIFAPLLMMMLWAIVSISDALVGSTNRSFTLSQAVAHPGDPGAATVFINYLVICGLLFGAIKLSSSLSAKSDSLLFGIGGQLRRLPGTASEQTFSSAAQRIRDRRVNREDAKLARAESAMKSASNETDYARAKKDVDKIKSRINTTGDFRDSAVMKALAKVTGVPIGKPEKKKMSSDIETKRAAEDKKAKDYATVVRGFNEKNASAEKEKAVLNDQRTKETKTVADEIEKLGVKLAEAKNKEGAADQRHKELKQQSEDASATLAEAMKSGDKDRISSAEKEQNQRLAQLSEAGTEIKKIRDEIEQHERDLAAKNEKRNNILSEFDARIEAEAKKKSDLAEAVRTKARSSLEKILGDSGEHALSERALNSGVDIITMDEKAYKRAVAEEKRIGTIKDAVKGAMPAATETTHTEVAQQSHAIAPAAETGIKPATKDH